MHTKKSKPYVLPKGKVLIMRTNAADGKSHGGFQWPKSGLVKCPDWKATKKCGNGLHGWLWGEGDGGLANWSEDAVWIVAEVNAKEIIDLCGKVKFPSAKVIHYGDRKSAPEFIAKFAPQGAKIVRGTATAGDSGTATAGKYGVLSIEYYDGERYRRAICEVDDSDIKANKPYRVEVKDGKPVFVEASK